MVMETENFTKNFFETSLAKQAAVEKHSSKPTFRKSSISQDAEGTKKQVGPIRRPSETTITGNFDINSLEWINAPTQIPEKLAVAPRRKPTESSPLSLIPTRGADFVDFNEFRLFGSDNQEINNDMDKLLHSSSSSSGLLSLWSNDSYQKRQQLIERENSVEGDASLKNTTVSRELLRNTNQAWNSVLLNDFDSNFEAPLSGENLLDMHVNSIIAEHDDHQIIKNIWSSKEILVDERKNNDVSSEPE